MNKSSVQRAPIDMVETAPEIDRKVVLAGTALASFATLLLELALTRLFSVVLYYHFAFLAISLAMLGLGAGGVFSYVKRSWLSQYSLRDLACAICIVNSGTVLLALSVALHTPVLLVLEFNNIVHLTEIYVAAGVPFFLTGLLLSLVFARESRHMAVLYGADLTGGALGCLAVIPLLNIVGGPNAVVCAALAMAVAAGIWAATSRQRMISVGLVALMLALLVANHSERMMDVIYAKGGVIDAPSVEFARWNAISRVEVFAWGAADKGANIDADAATLIVHADARDPKSADYVKSIAASSAMPSLLRPHGAYAIIGPGGGIDVLSAVVGGSPSVTGIEINPLIANSIMRGGYADYTHHLYEMPQVHIHVSDGRSWIRASQDKYDVIQMTLVDTWASTSAGAFALSENNLYTAEAFREYFDHLKSDGFLAITRWDFSQPREALRVESQAIEVLRQLGVADPRKNFMVIANGRLNERGSQVTVLAKKSAFTVDEERTILGYVQSNPRLYPLYTPNVYGQPEVSANCVTAAPAEANGKCIEPELTHLAETRIIPSGTRSPFVQLITLPWRASDGSADTASREKFIRDYPFEIAPVTDNAPFFFFTFKTRRAVSTFLNASQDPSLNPSIDWKNNLGVVTLGVMLIVSIVAVIGFLLVPLAMSESTQKTPVLPMLYFVAIGVGFILVEISLIQRFVLFLGHPTYAVTVVVFLMLLSGGMGSFVSKAWLRETLRVRAVLGIIVGIVLLYTFVLPGLLRAMIALPFPMKVALSAALLIPLGLAMGMPFPTGLRELASHSAHSSEDSSATPSSAIEWAWAVNAAAGVLGSVLAILIALHFGLDATLGCAAAAYFVAAVLTLAWQNPRAAAVDDVEPIPAVSVEV